MELVEDNITILQRLMVFKALHADLIDSEDSKQALERDIEMYLAMV